MDELTVLERRIGELERKVYGSSMKCEEGSASVIEQVMTANVILNAAANGRKNIGNVNKRLEELNVYVDTGVQLNGELERKLNVILSQRERYLSDCATLEKIESLNSAVDQGYLKHLEETRIELASLVDEFTALTTTNDETIATSNLLGTYKDLVLETSRALAAANIELTKIEAKKLGLNDNSVDD